MSGAMESVQNVISNAIAPVDFRKEGQLIGTLEYVGVEVAVSKIIRAMLKMENRSVAELAFIHLLSIPFLGGTSIVFGAKQAVRTSDGYGTAAFDGAKGIPAVLLAQWVVATSYKGFHLPWFNVKDLMITAGSKILSRPLVRSVIDKLPADAMQVGFDVIDELVRRQGASSNLNRA